MYTQKCSSHTVLKVPLNSNQSINQSRYGVTCIANGVSCVALHVAATHLPYKMAIASIERWRHVTQCIYDVAHTERARMCNDNQVMTAASSNCVTRAAARSSDLLSGDADRRSDRVILTGSETRQPGPESELTSAAAAAVYRGPGSFNSSPRGPSD